MFLQSQDHNLIQFAFLNTTVLGTGGGRANMTMENEKMNKTGSLTLKGVVVQSLSVSDSLQPHGLQHARPPCPSLSPGVCSNSCPLNQWCYPTISSSVIPFSFCPQSFPASRSFPTSQLFASGGQNIGTSAIVLSINIQDWFPLDWPVWSPCSPRESQESSPTPQLESINSSPLSHLYGPPLTSIHDYWKNYGFDYMNLCW